MPSGILYPRKRTLEKPLEAAQLTGGHPLLDGLVFAWLPQDAQLALDLARGIPGTYNGAVTPGAGPAAGSSVNPNVAAFTGTSSATSAFVDFGTVAPGPQDLVVTAGQPATWIVRAFLNAAVNGALLNRSDNNGSIGWGLWVQDQASTAGLTFLTVCSSGNMRARGPAYATGVWIDFAVVYDGSTTAANQKIYYDGLLQTTVGANNGSGTKNSDAAINLYGGRAVFGVTGCIDGKIAHAYIWKNRALTAEEIMQLHLDPYCLIQLPRSIIGTMTGALAPVTGNASITEAADTISAAGAVAVAGASAITEAADTISAAGAVAIAGSLSKTEAGDTISAAGAVAIAGSSAITEGADTLVAAASEAVHGSADITEGDDTIVATAAHTSTGSAAITEDPDTVDAQGAAAFAARPEVFRPAHTIGQPGGFKSTTASGAAPGGFRPADDAGAPGIFKPTGA